MELIYKSDAPAALWKPVLLPVYVLFGEEDRLKDEAIAALTEHVVPSDWRDFDLEMMEAGSVDAVTILAAAGQIPFGAERRLVIVKGLEQWRDRNKQGEAERLAEGIGRLPTSACLALVAAAEDDEAKRKTAITTKLDNAAKKVGALVAFRALKGEGLTSWVAERAQQEGKRIEPSACQLLVEAVGSEMLLLEQEIRKLAAYVGHRPAITGRDVGIVVASTPEDVMFTTVDAITRRQADRALTLLSELHRYDPKPQAVAGKLLALLGRQYRMLWQAKFLAERRVNPRDVRALPPDIAAELPGEANIAQLAFKAPDLFATAKGMSWADLTRAMDLLLLCDLANKGGVTEETNLFGSDVVRNLQLLTLSLASAGSKLGSVEK
jgi:DNA polymerase III subunit delta